MTQCTSYAPLPPTYPIYVPIQDNQDWVWSKVYRIAFQVSHSFGDGHQIRRVFMGKSVLRDLVLGFLKYLI